MSSGTGRRERAAPRASRVGLAAVVVLGAGCAKETPRSAEATTIRVLAAASFTDVLGTIEQRYERAHEGATVELAFGGSQELRMQLEHGADADLFVSANRSHVEALERAGRATGIRALPCNHLVVVTGRGNPLGIKTISDLARASRVVLGVESAPIGKYTGEVLAKLAAREGDAARDAILARVVSRELDVRQVIAKVRLGEADAAIVYATDARSAGDAVVTVPIEPTLDVVTHAFVARVAPAKHAPETSRFLDYLASDEATRAFHAAGFIACTDAR